MREGREIKFRGKRIDNGEWEVGTNYNYLLHNQLNNTTMTTTEKKQAILNVIFERAIELENEAISLIGLVLPKNVDYEALKEAALKKAFQEWKDNKPVFDKPAFL